MTAFHHAPRVDVAKAKALVETVRVGGPEHDSRALQVRVSQCGLDEPDAEAGPTVGLEHEYVAQPRKASSVCHGAGEADLLTRRAVEAEDERVVDRAFDASAGHALGPIAPLEKAPDGVAVQAGAVSRDQVAIAAPIHDYPPAAWRSKKSATQSGSAGSTRLSLTISSRSGNPPDR